MVTLRRIEANSLVEEGLVEERFMGPSGRYWKTGTNGTATMFSSWLRANLRDMTTNNSTVKTSRDFVVDNNGFEEFVMSFGRKEEKPLDIHVGVAEGRDSYIGLEYFKNANANKRDIDTYIIRDPMALSVNPVTKKLRSVVFKGDQFSFAGSHGKLDSIPGYTEALKALSAPIRKAASILDYHDDNFFKSRNLMDFEASPEVNELKDLYKDWNVEVDTSKLASSNKVTYRFTHPTNPDFNFTVYFQDEGGGKYRTYATFRDHEMSIDNLNKALDHEREALNNAEYTSNTYQSSSNDFDLVSLRDRIFKNKNITLVEGFIKSSLPDVFIEDASNINQKMGKDSYYSIRSKDPSLDLEFQFYSDGDLAIFYNDKMMDSLEDLKKELANKQESYSRKNELRKAKVSGDTLVQDYVKDTTVDLDTIVKRLNKAIDDPHIDRLANLDITRYDDKETWELKLTTQHGEETLVWEIDLRKPIYDTVFIHNSYFNDVPTLPVTFNTPEFYNIITRQVEKFRRDYAVYKTLKADISNTGDYINQDYDLANWADFVLNTITPELDRLQDKYNLVLNQDTDINSLERDRTGKLLFSGSYVDRSFADHLLELRINYDRGEHFIVWVRPDLKGTTDTKADGQTDLSFFTKWVENNVAPRSLKMDSESYRAAIEKELLGMGGIPGNIKGTIEVTTSKIKPVVIDLKVTNNKVLVTAYRDNRVVASIDIDASPFSVTPKLMAKDILSRLSKTIKESFPSIDRQYPNLKKYVEGLFKDLESEGIKKVSEQNILVGNRSYLMDLDPFGCVTIKSSMGRVLKEALLLADEKNSDDDMKKLKSLFQF